MWNLLTANPIACAYFSLLSLLLFLAILTRGDPAAGSKEWPRPFAAHDYDSPARLFLGPDADHVRRKALESIRGLGGRSRGLLDACAPNYAAMFADAVHKVRWRF